MDWQIAPGVPSSQIVKRTLCLDFANDGYPNASCNSSESNLLCFSFQFFGRVPYFFVFPH